jgi:hypothetical protein
MWIKTFILSILMLATSRVFACDACGCGPGAAFLQAMPQFGRRSVDLSTSLRGGRSEVLPFAAVRYQHAVGDRSALWVQVPVSASYYRGYWSDGTYAEHLLGGLGDPNVGAMHRCNPPLAHRDIKAENVLRGADGVWKVCDFGSATTRSKAYTTKRDIAEEEERIQKYSTPQYKAPEMCDLYAGKVISEKVDVWALGVLLYLLTFRKHAFPDGNNIAIMGWRCCQVDAVAPS